MRYDAFDLFQVSRMRGDPHRSESRRSGFYAADRCQQVVIRARTPGMAVRTGWFGGLGEGGEADVDHLLPRPEHFGITVCQTDLFQCADQIEFVIERGLRERRIAVDPFEYGALVFVRNGVARKFIIEIE